MANKDRMRLLIIILFVRVKKKTGQYYNPEDTKPLRQEGMVKRMNQQK